MTAKALLSAVVTVAAILAVTEGPGECAPDRKLVGPPEISREPPIPPVHKDLRTNAKNIANLLRGGHTNAARKLAEAVAPRVDEVYDVMELYRPRGKGGLGWGSLPQPGAPVLDSLERTLMTFSRAVPVNVLNTPGNNEEAALWIAAGAQLTFAMAPKKDLGPRKTRVVWISFTEQLSEAAAEFRSAAAANNPKAMQQTASRVLNVCNNCHALFRD